MLAATTVVDLARLLLDLLIVVAAAKLAAELAERLGVPAVLGEIVAGIIVGPSVLGLVEVSGDRGVSLAVVAEIGVLLLLVQVGMEMDLAELGRVGRTAMLVATIGVAAPFALGGGAVAALGEPADVAIFLGAALTATSVGITARVFGDLRALATTEARVVLGAAVADDVIGLIILTVVVKVVSGGGVSAGAVGSTLAWAVGFLALAGFVGLVAVPRLFALVHRVARSGATLTVVALVVILGFAVLADAAQLAFIIGAFMAGLAIGRSGQQERVAADLNSVGAVFIPVFFVLIGVNTDVAAMFRPGGLVIAGALFVAATVGKLVAGVGASRLRADRLLIGVGMLPRGEVGLIFASIGLAQGVLDEELYGSLLLVVLLTTVVTPPVLRWRLGQGSAVVVAELDEDLGPPPAGWVGVDAGQIVLRGRPPTTSIVPVVLQAAELAAKARPSDPLLEWLAARRAVPLQWTSADTDRLVAVLRSGAVRSVRFLDVTGVLQRALPDVAAALDRRRHDPGELDPSHVLRFPTVARLDELVAELGPSERAGVDQLMLAGVVVDVAGPDPDPRAVSSLLRQLAVHDPHAVQAVLEGSALLRAAAAELNGFAPAELRQIAAHLGSRAIADAAYLLVLATDLHNRQGLDELHDQLDALLAHPELLGEGADSLAEVRRRQASSVAAEAGALERLRTAPVTYLLAHEPDELARQARLVEPLPRPGVVRVAVSPDGRPDHWIVEVACRDAEALLARLAGALTDAGADIVAATVATWPDGAVVDTFVVRRAVRLGARNTAERMERALRQRAVLEPVPGVDVSFDDGSLPWHTACTVRGADRPGVLAAVAAAFAAAGVVVHGARLAVEGDTFVGRVSVTDRHGRKLDESAKVRVERALAGSRARRSFFAGRR